MGSQSAVYAPFHRVLGRLPSADAGFPPDAAPQLDFAGSGLQDHRLRYNVANSATGYGVLGWYGDNPVFALNITPAALAANNIAAGNNAVSGTPMTLVSTTGAGITVLSATTVMWPSLTTVPSGTLVIGSTPTPLAFGSTFRSGFYDRTKMDARAVSITGNSSATGGNFTVSGYDVYGYAMSEVINQTGAGNTTNGAKAFKFITSVTPTFTDAHGYTIGTSDKFGLPIRTARFGDVDITYNSAVITASTGFVAADATTATTTTGDVRGTYAVQSASDGTKTLQVKIYPALTSMVTNFTTGLFGVAQA